MAELPTGKKSLTPEMMAYTNPVGGAISGGSKILYAGGQALYNTIANAKRKKDIGRLESQARTGGNPGDLANIAGQLGGLGKTTLTQQLPTTAGVGYSGQTAGANLKARENQQLTTMTKAGELYNERRRDSLTEIEKQRKRKQKEISDANQRTRQAVTKAVTGGLSELGAAAASEGMADWLQARAEGKGEFPGGVEAILEIPMMGGGTLGDLDEAQGITSRAALRALALKLQSQGRIPPREEWDGYINVLP